MLCLGTLRSSTPLSIHTHCVLVNLVSQSPISRSDLGTGAGRDPGARRTGRKDSESEESTSCPYSSSGGTTSLPPDPLRDTDPSSPSSCHKEGVGDRTRGSFRRPVPSGPSLLYFEDLKRRKELKTVVFHSSLFPVPPSVPSEPHSPER